MVSRIAGKVDVLISDTITKAGLDLLLVQDDAAQIMGPLAIGFVPMLQAVLNCQVEFTDAV